MHRPITQTYAIFINTAPTRSSKLQLPHPRPTSASLVSSSFSPPSLGRPSGICSGATLLIATRICLHFPPSCLFLSRSLSQGFVTYPEFVSALEKFGIYSSQGARGLFDRYHPAAIEDPNAPLPFAAFLDGLWAPMSHKPPPPPRRERSSTILHGPLDLRQSPANNWATSGAELSPHRRPVRVHSIANPAWRDQKPPQWKELEGSRGNGGVVGWREATPR